MIPLADVRPQIGIFDGVLATVSANAAAPVANVPQALREATRTFAADLGPDTPVVLTLNGPPVTAQTGGEFCEAEICPSDFSGMYRLAEAALNAALADFAPGQIAGFGVALFEGSHFDLQQPYQVLDGIELNRVGETGYNNPALNIYRAR